jgi:RimK family alpha-L-glutamate ligase
METALVLSDCKIPTPKTMPGLLCYNPTEDIREQTLDRLEENLGYPIVVKTSYGSLGKGVFKADNRKELRQLCEELKCQPHLFQQYIAKSFGTDIRVIVVGGKCIAAMMRKSDGDFRSNLELGGTGTAITPPDEVQKMCEKVARLLSLDYAGIDVLIGNDGYYLCEVNSNAFFGGIEQVTGTNIAAIYAEHIIKTIYH